MFCLLMSNQSFCSILKISTSFLGIGRTRGRLLIWKLAKSANQSNLHASYLTSNQMFPRLISVRAAAPASVFKIVSKTNRSTQKFSHPPTHHISFFVF